MGARVRACVHALAHGGRACMRACERADTLLQVHRARANRTAAQNEPSKAKRKVAHVASHVVLK